MLILFHFNCCFIAFHTHNFLFYSTSTLPVTFFSLYLSRFELFFFWYFHTQKKVTICPSHKYFNPGKMFNLTTSSLCWKVQTLTHDTRERVNISNNKNDTKYDERWKLLSLDYWNSLLISKNKWKWKALTQNCLKNIISLYKKNQRNLFLYLFLRVSQYSHHSLLFRCQTRRVDKSYMRSMLLWKSRESWLFVENFISSSPSSSSFFLYFYLFHS